MPEPIIRVVVAKAGLDGHDRGAKVIARALKDAGMEVIYTGIFQTPQQIVNTVLQEDADVLGISLLSGAHMYFAQEISRLLRAGRRRDPPADGRHHPQGGRPMPKELGFAAAFGPGTRTSEVVRFIREWMAQRRVLSS